MSVAAAAESAAELGGAERVSGPEGATAGARLPADHVFLVASGDLRLAANQQCWPAQAAMESALTDAFAVESVTVQRAHAFDPAEGHGFISSQRMGMDVFKNVPRDAPVVVAEAVWQYSHHVLAGLRDHRGPILTVGNWSGQWPGLVGLLNLNGSLTKAGISYSSLWSEGFNDEFFLSGLRLWIRDGRVEHDIDHVHDLAATELPGAEAELGRSLASDLRLNKAILGVFDEGCMGMYNAILEDELINATGVYKERLSQSALLAEMLRVSKEDARAVRRWLDERGFTFVIGEDEATELTEAQVHEQCKMYIAAVRMAHVYSCDAIGIQYQQGLKDMAPASDLVEGLLNDANRPPVYGVDGAELYAGRALPHFNEVDECAGLDAIITDRVLTSLGFEAVSTLHDVRWGEHFTGGGVDDFVWTLMISGAAPASHLAGGYAGSRSVRQPPMFFPRGGGTLTGVGKPGEVVWSRVFVMDGRLHADLGRATVVELPPEETERRWQSTNPEWPIVHAIMHGVTRDQLMARHKANHLTVAYAPSATDADRVLAVKAAMLAELGLEVHFCGIEV